MLYIGISLVVSLHLFSFQLMGVSPFPSPPSLLGRGHQVVEQLLKFSPGF